MWRAVAVRGFITRAGVCVCIPYSHEYSRNVAVPVTVCCLLLMLLCFSHNTDTLCMMCVRDASLIPQSNAYCASSHAVLTNRTPRRQPCVTYQHQLRLGGVPYPARQRPALSCTTMACVSSKTARSQTRRSSAGTAHVPNPAGHNR